MGTIHKNEENIAIICILEMKKSGPEKLNVSDRKTCVVGEPMGTVQF